MQSVIQEFTIGFFDSSGVFSIYMKRDDTNRIVKFHIVDNAEDYREFISNPHLVISLREQLPNGEMLPDVPIDKSAIDLEEMSITIPITKSMVQQSGVAHCELMFALTNEEQIITTVPFKLIIEESYVAYPNEDTQIEFDNWTELYVSVKSLEDEISTNEPIRIANENERISQENARQEAERERQGAIDAQVKQGEAWAVGTRGGVPVESGDETYHNNSKYYSEVAGDHEAVAGEYSEKSEAYAVGKRNGVDVPDTDETYRNNSKYYRDQAAAIMAELDGTIRAQGTCLFDELPDVSDARPGDMWNISDEFVTTSDFREGAGKRIPEGANVYMTTSSKWDIMAGAPVTGIKGNEENVYRKGNVNITPENVGAVNEDGGDTANTIVTYRGYDKQIDYEADAEIVEVHSNLFINNLTTETANNITWTKGTDGVINVSGTSGVVLTTYRLQQKLTSFTLPAGDYIFTDGTNDGLIELNLTDSGQAFLEENFVAKSDGVSNAFSLDESTTIYALFLYSSKTTYNKTYYPMVRLASDPDTTFIPCGTSVPVRTEVTIKGTVADGLTGYKNILTYPYFDSSKSENGLTFVDNKDGSITVNGICTEECYFNFFAHAIHPTLQRGSRIKLALRVISGTITSKYIEAWCRTNTGGTYPTSYSSGVLRDVGVVTSNSFPCSQYSDGQDSISVLFPNNVVCNNVVFDCMLMYDDEDETFVRASTIPPLESGERHKVLFSKLSAMFANIRKLWNTVTHNYYATYNNKSIPFRFGIDEDGNYGYYKDGADTVTPFKTVVDLGTGTSFNVSNITGYKKFTKDNFYIVCTSASGSSSSIGKQNGQWWTPDDGRICYDMVVNYTGNTASATIGKTYNQSTGVLTLSNMSASAGTSISGKVWSGGETHAYTSASGTVGVSIGYYVLLIY